MHARTSLLSLGAAIATVAALAPVASAATQRYAATDGAGTACTADSPCSLVDAVGGAALDDEVIVAPGDYALTATLNDPTRISLHGAAGRPRPRLRFSGAGQNGLRADSGSTVRGLEVDQDQDSVAIFASSGTKLDRLVVRSNGTGANVQSSTITNSIVISADNSGGRAVYTDTSGATNTSTYRNVTAIATGTGGIGVQARALFAGGKATINATNVIAVGGPGGPSVQVSTDSSGAQATINFTHSDTLSESYVGTNATIGNGPGNIHSLPVFADAAAGDYRQAPGAPTIGAGLDDAANGTADVDGDPRAVGTTDIGADEFVPAPGAVTGGADAVTESSAALSGTVNPQGAPATYRFEYGPTAAYGSATSDADAGQGTADAAAGATIGGLAAGTTYHYRVVATGAGGTTYGDDRTFTTAAPAATPPAGGGGSPAPAGGGGSPAPFGGVAILSTRLRSDGRFVRVRLRCPAGTVGGCSGTTRIAAHGKVVVGRARFAIAAGRSATVRIRVSRAGRRLLARHRRVAVRVAGAARDGAGSSRTTVRAATISRRA